MARTEPYSRAEVDAAARKYEEERRNGAVYRLETVDLEHQFGAGGKHLRSLTVLVNGKNIPLAVVVCSYQTSIPAYNGGRDEYRILRTLGGHVSPGYEGTEGPINLLGRLLDNLDLRLHERQALGLPRQSGDPR